MNNEDTENQDSSTPEDVGEASQNNQPDIEDRLAELEQEIAKQREIAENQRIRAEKAEAKAKATPKPKTNEDDKNDYPDVDERILKAGGMPDELLKELKAIAKARDVTLIDAQNDSLFKLVKENYEQELKSKEASLGSSKGSGNAVAKKSPSTPGLSRDEHKAMWKQMNS
jgi:hypothetical protein